MEKGFIYYSLQVQTNFSASCLFLSEMEKPRQSEEDYY